VTGSTRQTLSFLDIHTTLDNDVLEELGTLDIPSEAVKIHCTIKDRRMKMRVVYRIIDDLTISSQEMIMGLCDTMWKDSHCKAKIELHIAYKIAIRKRELQRTAPVLEVATPRQPTQGEAYMRRGTPMTEAIFD
jgi:hypothetical protein